ncbi:MAG: hypothetical protein ACRYHA_19770 [Janthinobacterium lividum]
MRPLRLLLPTLFVLASLAGCSSIGPKRLSIDQVDYARALGEGKKNEILAAIVGFRYGDPPSFLSASSIITSYTVQATVGSTLSAGNDDYNFGQAVGQLAYSDHPTLTFSPTTGEAYANQYARPISPLVFLPLVESGVPIDVLLRLTVQSVAGLQNGSALGGTNNGGSAGFFQLLHVLRRLQLAGQLDTQIETLNKQPVVYMALGATTSGKSPQVDADVRLARKLLRLSPKTARYQIVYGTRAGNGRTIPLASRSVIGILTELGAQIDVPAQTVADGSTEPTVGLIGGETRPAIIIHVGDPGKRRTFARIEYDDVPYWIARNDFDSKYAFTILQNLIAIAESSQNAKAPALTIQAN